MTFTVIPRMSSTLMLAVRSQLANETASSVGYKLLMLQRSSASKFLPNSYVFPGGISETTDFSSEWSDLIGTKGLPLKTSMSNSPFYKSYTGLPANSLPAHIGFRICAIRETFEESGVLLVKPLAGNKQSAQDVYDMSDNELNSWRKWVHDDASLFLQLCKDIQCVPDVWSLYEWSNWITPGYQLRRYNTMFYFAFLDKEPEMSHDGKEVTSSLWIDPDEALSLCLRNKFNIALPQFYEMLRMCQFADIDELKTFVLSVEGVEEWEPVPVLSKNGDRIYIFPADTMYEKMKSETYWYYENFMKTTTSQNLKRIPIMKLPQTTEELCDKNQEMTRRIVHNEQVNVNLHLSQPGRMRALVL